jgi:hypothetical protein
MVLLSFDRPENIGMQFNRFYSTFHPDLGDKCAINHNNLQSKKFRDLFYRGEMIEALQVFSADGQMSICSKLILPLKAGGPELHH